MPVQQPALQPTVHAALQWVLHVSPETGLLGYSRNDGTHEDEKKLGYDRQVRNGSRGLSWHVYHATEYSLKRYNECEPCHSGDEGDAPGLIRKFIGAAILFSSFG